VLVTERNEQRAVGVVAEFERGGGTAACHLTALAGASAVRDLAACAAEADSDQTLTITVKVPFFLVVALAPAIAARAQGAIVSTSAIVASFGQPGMANMGQAAPPSNYRRLSSRHRAGCPGKPARPSRVPPVPTTSPQLTAASTGAGKSSDQLIKLSVMASSVTTAAVPPS
jgi:NAD(P)-dependent dehydrogenase (short-subunit alcohol dehydrogenase family)